MSCERYQQLLHLNKPGEISAEESAELREHVRRCEACSLELQRITRADIFLTRLRSFAPAPTAPDDLTASILRAAREGAVPAPGAHITDKILDMFLLPAVRFSAVATVLAFVGTFSAQSLLLLGGVSSVEKRMTSVSSGGDRITYTVRSKTLETIASRQEIKSLTGRVPFTLSEGRIRVAARGLDPVLSSFNIENVLSLIGSSTFRLDRITIERAIREVKATAERSFRAG